jgi:hypothetical protein
MVIVFVRWLCFLCGFWLVTRQLYLSYVHFKGVTKWATQACTIPRMQPQCSSDSPGVAPGCGGMVANVVCVLWGGGVALLAATAQSQSGLATTSFLLFFVGACKCIVPEITKHNTYAYPYTHSYGPGRVTICEEGQSKASRTRQPSAGCALCGMNLFKIKAGL